MNLYSNLIDIFKKNAIPVYKLNSVIVNLLLHGETYDNIKIFPDMPFICPM